MSGSGTLGEIGLFVALVTVAALTGLVVRRVAIPYTVALVLAGLAAGVLFPTMDVEVTPELVLAVLLPGLVFEAAYRLRLDELRRTFAGVAMLAIPGVLLTAVIVAGVLHFGVGLDPRVGIVVGAMVAATDPAAVIATFKRLGTPRRLATIVEGESLFNDGTGLVLFAIAVRAATADVTASDAIATFTVTIVGSLLLGGLAGYVASRLIGSVDDHLVELTISLSTAYGTYLLADTLHGSGVIATVVAGVVLGNYGRRGMSARTEDAIDTVWEFVAFLLTALVFLLVGLAITVADLLQAMPAILWTIIAITLARVVIVYGLLGGASRLRAIRRKSRGVRVSWLHVVFWSGLRGAVAVAMALSLPIDFPQRDLLQQITFGVVLYTLLVQATTVGWIVHRALSPRDVMRGS